MAIEVVHCFTKIGHRTDEEKKMSKVKYSRELGFGIVKEYLNRPSTASISRWLKAYLMQHSEELITDKAPEPFTLICRIVTLTTLAISY